MRTMTADLRTGPPPQWTDVTVDESGDWIKKALADVRRAPLCCVAYGSLFVVMSWGLVWLLLFADVGAALLPLASGYMLVGSMFAVPLHVISRAHERGETIALPEAIRRSLVSLPGLAIVGVALTLVMLTWIMLAMLIFALFYGGQPMTMGYFAAELLSSPQAALFLTTGSLVGAVMATVAFAIAALSIPLLVEKPDMLPIHAMAVSIEAVARQPGVMIGWGATVAFITAAGMIPGFLGLAFTVPLAGYASWHAYRALLPHGV